jgi:pyruvate/2-oxoglutarate dehydrogenase complex dihydrolipoamide acyltransferase (E2) component
VSSSPTETVVDVTMPQMGVSVAEGTVVEWRVGVGDPIEADQTICEISTDKIDTEVPAPVGGVVTEILVQVEETVPVGEVLARIAVEGGGGVGAPSIVPTPTAASPVPTPTAASPAPAPTAAPTPAPTRDAPESGAPSNGGGANGATARLPAGTNRPPGGRRYSPVVQRIAAQNGIDLSEVPGTGRGGRVRKQDVLGFIEAGGGAEAPVVEARVAEAPLHIESPYRPEPAGAASPTLSRMRRQIGEHMKRSLETAATCTTWIEVDMSGVERARARLGVTALAFVARATIDALREHPALNAWLEGERYTAQSSVNLGIAVSLGDDGLIVPVVQDAHELSAEGLAARIKELARRARSRELTPDDVRGGTFTITNPGQYGSIMATPIINQPQVAILDFEAVVKRAVVVTDSDGNDSIAIRPITILGLSWDHRALDGVLAAQFLATVKSHLEGSAAV